MKYKFEWEDKFIVGVQAIDEQHKKLFSLGNNVQYARASESRAVLLILEKYAEVHFKFEEEHMRNINFPGYAEHKRYHEVLINSLMDHINSKIETEADFDKVKFFIYHWITDHILAHDKKYFDYSNHTDSE